RSAVPLAIEFPAGAGPVTAYIARPSLAGAPSCWPDASLPTHLTVERMPPRAVTFPDPATLPPHAPKNDDRRHSTTPFSGGHRGHAFWAIGAFAAPAQWR